MRFCDIKTKTNGDFVVVPERSSNICTCFTQVWMFNMGDMLMKSADKSSKMFLKHYSLKNI